MSDAGDFVDAALQREGTWKRASADKSRLASDLEFYGASVGAVRGAVRDVSRRYPGLPHDEITALSSELWSRPVFERRLAAVVLLQSNLQFLKVTDLTRIEGFVRTGRVRALVDPLAIDVIGPAFELFDNAIQVRANLVLDRWAMSDDAWLRRAALLSPLRAFRADDGAWAAFSRRAKLTLEDPPQDEPDVAFDAIRFMMEELATLRPEQHP